MNGMRCTLALAVCFSLPAYADGYPARPLRLIVPFPAGGGSDAVARIVSPRLGERLGQQIVVDNRGGAGGSIGTEQAVRATPDGYTMALASTSEIAINPGLYKLAYDTVRDLMPVSLVASTAIVVAIAPNTGFNSLKDLVAAAKSKPNTINVASAGNGTITHLSGELFRGLAKLEWTHVPYKGAPLALADLAGGRVQVMFSSLPAAMPLIKSGRIKAVAMSTRERQAALPEVPTVIESGMPAYDVVYWYGVFVPAATPKAAAARLAEEIAQTLKQKDVIASLASQGAAAGDSTQPQFAQFVKSEHARWTGLVKSAGVKAD
ncbi:MAG TPA: tripartite tricarboxylate transporter substrate binding protein [Burkholderiales bacterium]|nr:tripartite tricarboxylate transporter substrate binding protein [Burkholderiales bacterium]